MGPQSPRGTGRDTAAPEEDEGPRFRHDSSFYGRISAVVEDARRRIAGAEDMLAALGLGVQCLTEIRPGAISFTYYLAGCGIFHEIEGDDLAAAGSFARTSDGRILFRSGRTGAGVELVEDGTLRDFRQYTVLDNIGWCLACLEVRSDNADEVSFHGGSFAFHAGMPLLMKYLNPDAFPDSLYLDGIPDITGMTSPLSFDKA